MKKIRIISIIILTFVMSSCSTGKKSLERGNYYDAVIKAVERLRSNPDSKNARQTLKDAYPLANEVLLQEIDILLAGNEQFKYAGIVDRYEKINTMAAEIRRSPAARSLKLDIKEYTTQLAGVKSKAALESYNYGEEMLAKGDRSSAKEAFFLFETANKYENNYRDASKKMDIARDLATLFVVVEDIAVPGLYKLNSEFFQNQIISNLSKKYAKDFIVFMNPDEAKNLNRADHVIMMRFDDFVVGSSRDKDLVKEITSKDSVKVGTATIDGKKVDIFNRVKATYTTHSRQIISSGLLDVKVIDVSTEKLLGNKKFPGQFVWVTEWASYNGDKRALSQEQVKLARIKPQMPPPPQQLFLEFTKPIYNQTESYLKNIYRRY